MKKKAIAVVAGACTLGMLLSGCGGSGGDSNASGGANVITAFNSEPQNALIPGDTNETGGGKVGQLLFANLVRYDSKGDTKMEVADSIQGRHSVHRQAQGRLEVHRRHAGDRRILHQVVELHGEREERAEMLVVLQHDQGL